MLQNVGIDFDCIMTSLTLPQSPMERRRRRRRRRRRKAAVSTPAPASGVGRPALTALSGDDAHPVIMRLLRYTSLQADTTVLTDFTGIFGWTPVSSRFYGLRRPLPPSVPHPVMMSNCPLASLARHPHVLAMTEGGETFFSSGGDHVMAVREGRGREGRGRPFCSSICWRKMRARTPPFDILMVERSFTTPIAHERLSLGASISSSSLQYPPFPDPDPPPPIRKWASCCRCCLQILFS